MVSSRVLIAGWIIVWPGHGSLPVDQIDIIQSTIWVNMALRPTATEQTDSTQAIIRAMQRQALPAPAQHTSQNSRPRLHLSALADPTLVHPG